MWCPLRVCLRAYPLHPLYYSFSLHYKLSQLLCWLLSTSLQRFTRKHPHSSETHICYSDIKNWMMQSKLQLKGGKTYAMPIGTKQKLSSDSIDTLQLDDFIVPLSQVLLIASAFSSTTHCACKTSLTKPLNPVTTSFAKSALSGGIFPLRLQRNWSPHSFCHALITTFPSFVVFLLPLSIAFSAFRTVLLTSSWKNVKLTTSVLYFSLSTNFQYHKEFSTR